MHPAAYVRLALVVLDGSHPTPLAGFLPCPVRLPQLLAQSALTAAEVTQVQKLLGDFLRFMQKNYATFFVQEYEAEEPVGLCFTG